MKQIACVIFVAFVVVGCKSDATPQISEHHHPSSTWVTKFAFTPNEALKIPRWLVDHHGGYWRLCQQNPDPDARSKKFCYECIQLPAHWHVAFERDGDGPYALLRDNNGAGSRTIRLAEVPAWWQRWEGRGAPDERCATSGSASATMTAPAQSIHNASDANVAR
jgi:hypothetical protein